MHFFWRSFEGLIGFRVKAYALDLLNEACCLLANFEKQDRVGSAKGL